MVDSIEDIINKLTYSDSRVGEAFEKYKKEIGNVFERAKNLMRVDRFSLYYTILKVIHCILYILVQICYGK